MSNSNAALVKIATLKKPYGIKGWLWVFSETDDRTAIFAMPNWQLKTPTGFQNLTVKQWRVQGAGLVVRFEEITDRNTAERLYGATIWVEKSALPKPAVDEYLWVDLVGLRVVNGAGEYLGVIQSLFETGANDVMVVVPAEGSVDVQQRLIPWHKSVVLEVDLSGKTMLVDWGADY